MQPVDRFFQQKVSKARTLFTALVLLGIVSRFVVLRAVRQVLEAWCPQGTHEEPVRRPEGVRRAARQVLEAWYEGF